MDRVEEEGYRLRRELSPELEEKIRKRMEAIDRLTPEQRSAVHELGWGLVKTFMQHGVTSPRSMRALVRAMLVELRPPEIEQKLQAHEREMRRRHEAKRARWTS